MITHKIISDTQNALADYLHYKKIAEEIKGAIRMCDQNDSGLMFITETLCGYEKKSRRAKAEALLNMAIMQEALEDDNI